MTWPLAPSPILNEVEENQDTPLPPARLPIRQSTVWRLMFLLLKDWQKLNLFVSSSLKAGTLCVSHK